VEDAPSTRGRTAQKKQKKKGGERKFKLLRHGRRRTEGEGVPKVKIIIMIRTWSEEEPKEPHRHGGQIVVRRPRVVPNRNLRARRPVLREPKVAQPAVEPGILAKLPLVLPVVLQHHQVRRPEHLVQRPHPFLRQSTPTTTPSAGTGATGESGKRIDRAPDLRPQPPELHAPPPQLRRELRRPRRRPRAESPHERSGVEFGGKDARVEVRVGRAREGRVQASVDEQERDQFARWAEWVARHGEQRDVLQELVRDRVERRAHSSSPSVRSFVFVFFFSCGPFLSSVLMMRCLVMVVLRQTTTRTDGDHRNDDDRTATTGRNSVFVISSDISTSDFFKLSPFSWQWRDSITQYVPCVHCTYSNWGGWKKTGRRKAYGSSCCS